MESQEMGETRRGQLCKMHMSKRRGEACQSACQLPGAAMADGGDVMVCQATVLRTATMACFIEIQAQYLKNAVIVWGLHTTHTRQLHSHCSHHPLACTDQLLPAHTVCPVVHCCCTCLGSDRSDAQGEQNRSRPDDGNQSQSGKMTSSLPRLPRQP